MNSLTTTFPAARYRFEFVAETPIRLPEYAGSTLRGVFGRALRRTACMTRQKECKPCPLYRSCPYPAIFEPPPPLDHALQKFTQIPAPFVIEPPGWGACEYAPGDPLAFNLVLIGRTHAHLPLVIYAMQQAMAQGAGKGDGRARLLQVCLAADDGDIVIHQSETGQLQEHPFGILAGGVGQAPESISLHIDTPLRLQHNGRPIRPAELTARDFLVSLLRRIALLSEFHAGQKLDLDFHHLSEQATRVRAEGSLAWRDWTRFSSRQQQEMVLGGCVGEWTLNGNLAPFMSLLRLGQWLHVGKNATFGLGKYCIRG